VEAICKLTEKEIIKDGDEGASEIYQPLVDEVNALVSTDVARAVLDMNRSEDDRSKDGVVKTHTCWDVPVYSEFPSEEQIKALIQNYYLPYHARLSILSKDVVLGVDCHTMAAKAPPVAPDPGSTRPILCLSNAGFTCPQQWLLSLAEVFQQVFEEEVGINSPFQGGYIIRSHAEELPWIQLEISRASFYSNEEKCRRVLVALGRWCKKRL
jgi:N-formylglutamate amidohydrolase